MTSKSKGGVANMQELLKSNGKDFTQAECKEAISKHGSVDAATNYLLTAEQWHDKPKAEKKPKKVEQKPADAHPAAGRGGRGGRGDRGRGAGRGEGRGRGAGRGEDRMDRGGRGGRGGQPTRTRSPPRQQPQAAEQPDKPSGPKGGGAVISHGRVGTGGAWGAGGKTFAETLASSTKPEPPQPPAQPEPVVPVVTDPTPVPNGVWGKQPAISEPEAAPAHDDWGAIGGSSTQDSAAAVPTAAEVLATAPEVAPIQPEEPPAPPAPEVPQPIQQPPAAAFLQQDPAPAPAVQSQRQPRRQHQPRGELFPSSIANLTDGGDDVKFGFDASQISEGLKEPQMAPAHSAPSQSAGTPNMAPQMSPMSTGLHPQNDAVLPQGGNMPAANGTSAPNRQQQTLPPAQAQAPPGHAPHMQQPHTNMPPHAHPPRQQQHQQNRAHMPQGAQGYPLNGAGQQAQAMQGGMAGYDGLNYDSTGAQQFSGGAASNPSQGMPAGPGDYFNQVNQPAGPGQGSMGAGYPQGAYPQSRQGGNKNFSHNEPMGKGMSPAHHHNVPGMAQGAQQSGMAPQGYPMAAGYPGQYMPYQHMMGHYPVHGGFPGPQRGGYTGYGAYPQGYEHMGAYGYGGDGAFAFGNGQAGQDPSSTAGGKNYNGSSSSGNSSAGKSQAPANAPANKPEVQQYPQYGYPTQSGHYQHPYTPGQ